MFSRGLAVVQRGLAGDTACPTKTSANPLKMSKLVELLPDQSMTLMENWMERAGS